MFKKYLILCVVLILSVLKADAYCWCHDDYYSRGCCNYNIFYYDNSLIDYAFYYNGYAYYYEGFCPCCYGAYYYY